MFTNVYTYFFYKKGRHTFFFFHAHMMKYAHISIEKVVLHVIIQSDLQNFIYFIV